MLVKKFLLSVLVLSAAVLFLLCSSNAADAALSALSACIRKVIPSLFPYMVLSTLMITFDLAAPLSKFIPMRLFVLPSCTAPVLVTGLLCGFPVGASGSIRLCSDGKISKKEAARLTALSSHASPAFCIGVIGSLWKSNRFGVWLYFCGIVFTILSGLFFNLFCPKDDKSAFVCAHVQPSAKFLPVFCRAVTDAASACLSVTAFIVFFRVCIAVLTALFPQISTVSAVVLEFSAGTSAGAAVGGLPGAVITGFAVGFSGLSVLAQIAAYLTTQEIAVLPVFAVKLAEGFFTAAAAAVFYHLVPIEPAADTFLSVLPPSPPALFIIPAVLIVLAAAGHFFFPKNKFITGT